MLILHSLLNELKDEFTCSGKGKERGTWFLHTMLAIILPFTSSRTSNLLRAFRTLFGFADIGKKRYCTFMASPKIPWDRLWKMIPEPETNGRFIMALDDYINPKIGRKIFGCAKVFDHAAKQNQPHYPWAQDIVAIGLLKMVKGRWACLPLRQRYYLQEEEIKEKKPTFKGKEIAFQSKHQQAAEILGRIAVDFPSRISWLWPTPGLATMASGSLCEKNWVSEPICCPGFVPTTISLICLPHRREKVPEKIWGQAWYDIVTCLDESRAGSGDDG